MGEKMITAYHRPQKLEEALTLISRPGVRPLGGGTMLNQIRGEDFEVVDLQALGLDQIKMSGEKLEIGATASLEQLLRGSPLPTELATALRLETPLNLRNMGTVAGTLVSCDGRSPFATAMLALDAKLSFVGLQDGKPTTMVRSLGDFLALKNQLSVGILITRIEIPLAIFFRFEYIARTPADRPIICAALARWPAGRTRLALGGWGDSPILAMDGNEPGGVEAAARNAYETAGDEWASAEYRREMAAVLAKRCSDKPQSS
jgi:CO/xanthine dehydrogenase FAD-binding subunit